MKLVPAIAVIALLILSGCTQSKPKQESNISVTYEIGSGWTGWNKKIVIGNDGSLLLEEKAPFDGNLTTKSGRLSASELAEFRKLVNNANILGLKDDYSCISENVPCPTDLPASSIKFSIDRKEKTISFYAPKQVPDSLTQIVEKMQKLSDNVTGQASP